MEDRHHLNFDTYEEGKLTLEEYLGRVVFCQKRPFTRAQFWRFMFVLYDEGEPLKRGLYEKIDRVGLSGTTLTFKAPTGKSHNSRTIDLADQRSAVTFLLDWLETQLARVREALEAEPALHVGEEKANWQWISESKYEEQNQPFEARRERLGSRQEKGHSYNARDKTVSQRRRRTFIWRND